MNESLKVLCLLAFLRLVQTMALVLEGLIGTRYYLNNGNDDDDYGDHDDHDYDDDHGHDNYDDGVCFQALCDCDMTSFTGPKCEDGENPKLLIKDGFLW